MKRETAKRVLALLICVLMTASLLPTVAMAEEVTEDVIDDSTIEAYTSYENGEDAGVSGVSVTDEKPNTDIKVIPSDANALILMDTGAQSPQGVPGQVVKIVLPLAVNKEYLPSEKYMLRNINIYPDVPTDASVSNWPFELIYASDVQHLKDMSYNSTAEAWFEFKISEFASKGRYAVPFKINATVWREDAVNGTTITEDVTFKVSAYVTVTDNGNMSGVTTSFGSLQVAGTNAGGSYTVPTGTPNQTIVAYLLVLECRVFIRKETVCTVLLLLCNDLAIRQFLALQGEGVFRKPDEPLFFSDLYTAKRGFAFCGQSCHIVGGQLITEEKTEQSGQTGGDRELKRTPACDLQHHVDALQKQRICRFCDKTNHIVLHTDSVRDPAELPQHGCQMLRAHGHYSFPVLAIQQREKLVAPDTADLA